MTRARCTKRLLRIAAALLALLLLLPVGLAAALQPTSAFYVNDAADVLSDEHEQSIVNTSHRLYEKTGAQVVVVTVPSLEGETIERYAIALARDWGIGSAEKNNGALILLSTGDREVRIEVGKGLEGCLTDVKTGRLLDAYAIPYYKEDAFDEGTYALYCAVINEVCAEYGVDALAADAPTAAESTGEALTEELNGWELFLAIVFLVILLAIFGGMFWLLLLLPCCAIWVVLLLVDLITGGRLHQRFWRKVKPLFKRPVRRGGGNYRGGGFGGFGGGGFGGGGGGFSGGGGGFSGGGSSRGF